MGFCQSGLKVEHVKVAVPEELDTWLLVDGGRRLIRLNLLHSMVPVQGGWKSRGRRN